MNANRYVTPILLSSALFVTVIADANAQYYNPNQPTQYQQYRYNPNQPQQYQYPQSYTVQPQQQPQNQTGGYGCANAAGYAC
jgi:hypothetical protein